MISQKKNNRILYHENYHLIEKPALFKNPDAYWIILEFFEKYKCRVIAFVLQRSRYISNKQPYLKTTGLYEDLFLSSSFFFYFIFNAPISLVYVFQFLHLFFLMFFLKPLLSIVEKLLYTYI